jgi:hypothetical protein
VQLEGGGILLPFVKYAGEDFEINVVGTHAFFS